MSLVTVFIGRTSGPCTDQEVCSDFTPEQVETVKDVLAMVNKATNRKERWYLTVGEDATIIVPEVK